MKSTDERLGVSTDVGVHQESAKWFRQVDMFDDTTILIHDSSSISADGIVDARWLAVEYVLTCECPLAYIIIAVARVQDGSE